MIKKEDNIFLISNEDLHKNMRTLSDEETLEHLKNAKQYGWQQNHQYTKAQVWSIYHKYSGSQHTQDYYNALHACAINGYLKSAHWLLQEGLDPNEKTGNENTALTFLLTGYKNTNITSQELLNFFDILKSYGANFSLSGYEGKAPLVLYSYYNNKLEQPIVDYLIEHADFENTFLLNEVFKDERLFTMKNIKKIMSCHQIDLKKTISVNNDSTNYKTFWDSIAFNLNKKHHKSSYEKITWLHDKIGFDIDSWHRYKRENRFSTITYRVNLLGLAIQAQNNNLFNWVLKRKPEYLKDTFFINDKPYSLLEFAMFCGFRKAVQLALKTMTHKEFISLDTINLKALCHMDTSTIETFDKTYTSLLYKNMSSQLEGNIKIVRKKI